MAEDTRKDQRVKAHILRAKYKSSTVEEFIEHYARDISRSGIFIKAAKPPALGTLLKIEIQLRDGSPVLMAVGKVVERREEPESTAETPAGMGIQFLKVEEASLPVIDRIMAVKGEGAGPHFKSLRPAAPSVAPPSGETRSEFFGATNPSQQMPPEQDRTVMRQMNALLGEALRIAADTSATPKPESKPPEALGTPAQNQVSAIKSTMLGVAPARMADLVPKPTGLENFADVAATAPKNSGAPGSLFDTPDDTPTRQVSRVEMDQALAVLKSLDDAHDEERASIESPEPKPTPEAKVEKPAEPALEAKKPAEPAAEAKPEAKPESAPVAPAEAAKPEPVAAIAAPVAVEAPVAEAEPVAAPAVVAAVVAAPVVLATPETPAAIAETPAEKAPEPPAEKVEAAPLKIAETPVVAPTPEEKVEPVKAAEPKVETPKVEAPKVIASKIETLKLDPKSEKKPVPPAPDSGARISIPSEPVSAVPRAPVENKRSSSSMYLAIAVVVTLVGGAAWVISHRGDDSQSTQEPTPEPTPPTPPTPPTTPPPAVDPTPPAPVVAPQPPPTLPEPIVAPPMPQEPVVVPPPTPPTPTPPEPVVPAPLAHPVVRPPVVRPVTTPVVRPTPPVVRPTPPVVRPTPPIARPTPPVEHPTPPTPPDNPNGLPPNPF